MIPDIEELEKRRVRRLKGLQINEISLVDRGAGEGVRVVLAKRDQERPMSSADIRKRADTEWKDFVAIVAKRDGIPEHKAVLKAAHDPRGLALLKICQQANIIEQQRLQDIGFKCELEKLGGDGLPQYPKVHSPEIGGRVTSDTQRTGHGAGHPSPFNPYDTVSASEDGDGALARYRAQFKARRKDGMDGLSARAKTFADIGVVQLSAADVLNEEAKANDELVAEQKSAERDANQLRRPSRGTSMSNGSGQNSLGVNSVPNRSM
jgi:hypothetical protein